MNHIQLIPLGGFENTIDVPYIANLHFDLQDFETYPIRTGFPPVGDAVGWQEIDPNRTANILQS